MRSISRRPCSSKRHSSTLVAVAENSAKFTPSPSQVAPSGWGRPSAIRDRRAEVWLMNFPGVSAAHVRSTVLPKGTFPRALLTAPSRPASATPRPAKSLTDWRFPGMREPGSVRDARSARRKRCCWTAWFCAGPSPTARKLSFYLYKVRLIPSEREGKHGAKVRGARCGRVAALALCATIVPAASYAQSSPNDRIDAIKRQIRNLQGELQHLKGALVDAQQQLRQSRSEAQRAQEQLRQAREAASRARQDALSAATSESQAAQAAAQARAAAAAPPPPIAQPAPQPLIVQTAGNRFGLESAG